MAKHTTTPKHRPRSPKKRGCGFCGDKFRSQKLRTKHAPFCTK